MLWDALTFVQQEKMAYLHDVVSGALLFNLLNTKSCIRRNATKVAGGTANSLATKTSVVAFERQRCTTVIVVDQLARTTAKYCVSCRI